LRLTSAYKMIEELMQRWDHKNKTPASKPVIIKEEKDILESQAPVRIRNDYLNLDLICYPPKDIALAIVYSSLATNAYEQQTSYGLRFFLDAALEDRKSTRLNSSHVST